MSDHTSSVFNNSCLKLPRNPTSHQPLPIYEQKYLNEMHNQARKLSLESNDLKLESSTDQAKSLIEFYDSIPEYNDINHLPNKEFYEKLEALKEKQKLYHDYLQNENKTSNWVEDYKSLASGKSVEKKSVRKPTIKPFCTTPILNKSPKFNKNIEDVESINLFDKDLVISKPPSRRSVRIESPSQENTPEPFLRPKSRFNLSSASSKGFNNDWDDLSIDDFKLDLNERPTPSETKSAPTTPTKSKPTVGWKDAGITIPKPFQMTVRDEEDKIVEELLIKNNKSSSDGKFQQFKAHSIPIESQIPLFDKIMADQERKNFIVRERSKALLQSQMRPFSFTKRDEELQYLTKRLSKSSPSLFLDDTPLKIKKFKAKPIPKNLFSNYIYKKMQEDEFYRTIQKKIRAEEMLRASSLPPSMAKRERRKEKFDVCPRSFRDLENEEKKAKNSKNSSKIFYDQYEKEFEELKREFLSPNISFKSKRSKKNKKSSRHSASSSSSKNSDIRTQQSSLNLDSVNRSNLAAVLRIQSARKRLEREMCRKLEESKLKEESRWKEKLMRKKPVWQALAYSQEEDLAMRLQLRRDEEKLRNEEHRLRMQMMLGRVNQQPTLFERQSKIKYPKTKAELIDNLYKEYSAKNRNGNRRSVSDLSDIRSFIEVKDEAIQAILDDESKQSSDAEQSSKESLEEEKEKCESPNSEDNEKSN